MAGDDGTVLLAQLTVENDGSGDVGVVSGLWNIQWRRDGAIHLMRSNWSSPHVGLRRVKLEVVPMKWPAISIRLRRLMTGRANFSRVTVVQILTLATTVLQPLLTTAAAGTRTPHTIVTTIV